MNRKHPTNRKPKLIIQNVRNVGTEDEPVWIGRRRYRRRYRINGRKVSVVTRSR